MKGGRKEGRTPVSAHTHTHTHIYIYILIYDGGGTHVHIYMNLQMSTALNFFSSSRWSFPPVGCVVFCLDVSGDGGLRLVSLQQFGESEDTPRKLSRNSLFLAKGRKEGGEKKVRMERKERKDVRERRVRGNGEGGERVEGGKR